MRITWGHRIPISVVHGLKSINTNYPIRKINTSVFLSDSDMDDFSNTDRVGKMKNNLRYYRKKSGMTLETIADKLSEISLAESGKPVSPGTISKLERGPENEGMELTQSWMIRLAEIYNCKPEDFVRDLSVSDEMIISEFVGSDAVVRDLKPVETASRPKGKDQDFRAIKIASDVWSPILPKGTIAYYSITHKSKNEFFGTICVVKIIGGEKYFGVLSSGSEIGLCSMDGPGVCFTDQKLEYAYKVTDYTIANSN